MQGALASYVGRFPARVDPLASSTARPRAVDQPLVRAHSTIRAAASRSRPAGSTMWTLLLVTAAHRAAAHTVLDQTAVRPSQCCSLAVPLYCLTFSRRGVPPQHRSDLTLSPSGSLPLPDTVPSRQPHGRGLGLGGLWPPCWRARGRHSFRVRAALLHAGRLCGVVARGHSLYGLARRWCAAAAATCWCGQRAGRWEALPRAPLSSCAD